MTRGALRNINVLSWDERIMINLAVVIGAITAGAAYKTVAHFPDALEEKPVKLNNLKELSGWLKKLITKHKAFLLLQAAVLLNTAAAVLCKRISVTKIAATSDAEMFVSTFGLLLFAGGGLLLGLSVIYRPLKASQKVVEATHAHSANGSANGGGNGTGNGNGNGKPHAAATETIVESTKPLPLVQYPELSAWLVIIAGVALVENSWMPLLSLPGILVGMKWYLSGNPASRQFAGDGEQLDISKARWKIVPFVY